ncbi:hypothetical protein BAU15_02915 [Enterococcus sp. JM4C]|uniref:hypothetical protein n=1 Tax=Candidatus Enterococcus huntleyi TaxID=1857217 RepID=UPI00137A2588|nr:hypothetical protein [Enterococcus sp. JM4C]KAF1299611.1 hypothetical protein BAU15_02915 [Enterococcus sp. JM4C]
MKIINLFFYYLYLIIPFTLTSLPILFFLSGYKFVIENNLLFLAAICLILPNLCITAQIVYDKNCPQENIFGDFFTGYLKKYWRFFRFSTPFLLFFWYLMMSVMIGFKLYGITLWTMGTLPILLLFSSWWVMLILFWINFGENLGELAVIKLGSQLFFSKGKNVSKLLVFLLALLLILPLFGFVSQVVLLPISVGLLAKLLPQNKLSINESEAINL